MRKTLDYYLANEYEYDYRLLISDLGHFPLVEKQNKLIDIGLQEANLVNIALGLTKQNIHVFIYSVAGFFIYRAFESLKYNFNINKNKLTILNAGAGFCYNKAGFGHHLVDDFALLNILNNVNIFAPVDRKEFKKILNNNINNKNITYIRLSLDDFPDLDIDNLNYMHYIDKKEYLNLDQNKKILITTGWLANYHYRFSQDKYYIFHVPKIKELRILEDTLYRLENRKIIIEDHIKFGGLSSFFLYLNFEHIYLPNTIKYSFNSREEYWRKYNLI
jgi:transketolase C-terminal domain/subunit